MKLYFYDVVVDYVKFIQDYEKKHRGYTKVPNMDYDDSHERKMLCGVVLEVNGNKYYVPVSSYKKQQDNNILIVLEKDRYNKVKGSLRFNYMFPVSDEYVNVRDFNKEIDFSRKYFLHKQLVYCDSIRNVIFSMALKTYNDVIGGTNRLLLDNSCDFKLLETTCEIYKSKQEVAVTVKSKEMDLF